jgi:hypothetical protein
MIGPVTGIKAKRRTQGAQVHVANASTTPKATGTTSYSQLLVDHQAMHHEYISLETGLRTREVLLWTEMVGISSIVQDM